MTNKSSQFSKPTESFMPRSKTNSGEFFLGCLNKSLTRNELYNSLKNYKLSNGQFLYINSFNQPRPNSTHKKSQKSVVNNVGYAFIVTRYKWMAEMMVKSKYIRLGKDTAVAQSIDDYKRGKCENDFMTSLDSSVNPAVKDAEVPFAKEESGYGSGFENTNTPRTSVSTSPGVSESSQKNFGSEDSGNSEVDSGHSESSINPRSRTQSQECLHVLENKTNRCEIAGIEDNVECQPEYTLIDLWRIYFTNLAELNAAEFDEIASLMETPDAFYEKLQTM